MCKYNDPNCTGSHNTGQRKANVCPSAYERNLVKQAERRPKRYARRKAAGVCTDCGSAEAVSEIRCQDCLDKQNERGMRAYYENRARAIELLGGECGNCGSTEELEFDHKIRADKTQNMSGLFYSYVWEHTVLQTELAKCQLLCKLCHQAKTAQEAGQNASAKQDQLDALLNQYGSEAA